MEGIWSIIKTELPHGSSLAAASVFNLTFDILHEKACV